MVNELCTEHKKVLAILVLVLFFTQSVFSLNENQEISVSPSQKEIYIGEEFIANINIETDAEIFAAEMTLLFDSSLLEIKSVEEGEFLKKDKTETFQILRIENESGKIIFANTRLGVQSGVSGKGDLVLIKFKAIDKGYANLIINEVKLVDTNISEILNVEVKNGFVKISGQNNPPTKPEIKITPDTAKTTDDLICNITKESFDLDGDEINYSYRWYKDNKLQQEKNNFIPSFETLKNEIWKCVVTPDDGKIDGESGGDFIKIKNTLPIAENLKITPSTPGTFDNLVASYDYSDADEDEEKESEIRWYKNGVLQEKLDNLLVVPYSKTLKNEKWYFTLKPKDDEEFGELIISDEVIVKDTKNISPIYSFWNFYAIYPVIPFQPFQNIVNFSLPKFIKCFLRFGFYC